MRDFVLRVFASLAILYLPAWGASGSSAATVPIRTTVARVLEIPTPRCATYDAVRNKRPLLPDVPSTIQERAWTSPIWYTPN